MLGSVLSPWSIFPVLLGPMIIFPVLYMRHSGYFLCTLCSGLWVDAALPVSFGLLTSVFLTIGAITFALRKRFRAEENHHPALLAQAANLIILLTLAATYAAEASNLFDFWIQTLFCLGLSQGLLLVVSPWFFNFQRLLIEMLHLDNKPEDLPLL
jgi:rod shape-determining protein MreD